MKPIFNFTFTPIPNDFLYQEEYKDMTIYEKVLYSILLAKHYQSITNKHTFSDEQGIFVYFTIESAQKALGTSYKTASLYFQKLEEKGLIKRVSQGACRAKKIYVNDIFCKKRNSTSLPQKRPEKPFQKPERQVSFDVEKAELRAQEGVDFGTKKNKPRRRY